VPLAWTIVRWLANRRRSIRCPIDQRTTKQNPGYIIFVSSASVIEVWASPTVHAVMSAICVMLPLSLLRPHGKTLVFHCPHGCISLQFVHVRHHCLCKLVIRYELNA
jgi:hypothetical protein